MGRVKPARDTGDTLVSHYPMDVSQKARNGPISAAGLSDPLPYGSRVSALLTLPATMMSKADNTPPSSHQGLFTITISIRHHPALTGTGRACRASTNKVKMDYSQTNQDHTQSCPVPHKLHQEGRLNSNRENPVHKAKDFIAYCDGSSLGNPGPGGWSYIITKPDGTRWERSGQLDHTTNNRAEIMAVIHLLLAVDRGDSGEIRLDSEYVVRAINEWRFNWERNGWKNAKGVGIANHDMFKVLFELADARPGVRFSWVKAHHTDALNNLCDRMARNEAEKAREGVR